MITFLSIFVGFFVSVVAIGAVFVFATACTNAWIGRFPRGRFFLETLQVASMVAGVLFVGYGLSFLVALNPDPQGTFLLFGGGFLIVSAQVIGLVLRPVVSHEELSEAKSSILHWCRAWLGK